MIKKFGTAALTLWVAWAFTACTKKPGTGAAERVVNLGIWASYLSPDTAADFERRTGIRIQISNYASNEELLAKMQAGGSAYDVIVPSDYMIFAMIKLGLLRPLDYSGLPNAKSLDPRFLRKKFDPGNKYSVPYDWGTTGIAVNRAVYKGEIRGWKDLFTKPDLAGKFTMIDDVRETIGAALKSLGYSLNSRNPRELEKAKELLLQNRKRIKGFTPDPVMTLTNGEAAVTHNYVSNALQASRALGGKVEYIFPKEGGTLWIDNLAIPASAPHPEEAQELINFLLEPKTVASTVMAIFVSPANRGALALLPRELAHNRALFPADKDLAKFEMIEDLGDMLLTYDRIWTEVKASAD